MKFLICTFLLVASNLAGASAPDVVNVREAIGQFFTLKPTDGWWTFTSTYPWATLRLAMICVDKTI